MKTRSGMIVVAVLGVVAAVTTGVAGEAAGKGPEAKPASLVAKNLVMVSGRAYLPISDLATALGGSFKCTPDGSKCDIYTGPQGVLALNRGALGAFTAARQGNVRENSKGVGQGLRAGVMNIQITINGADVGIQREEEEERLLLRPVPLMPLTLLAKLLGGRAVFDPGARAWRLPPGDPGCPLSFR